MMDLLIFLVIATFCFMYFEVLLLDACKFLIVIPSFSDCSFSSWFQSPFQISYIFASLFNSLHLDFPKQYWWKTERQEMCLIHHSIFEIQHFFILFSSFQSLSHVQLFATPWTAVPQASLSMTNSQSLLKLISTESVMPSNHFILCHPHLLSPSSLSQHQGLFQ